jgi:diguanylate cyclase (GGDEF)-like protein
VTLTKTLRDRVAGAGSEPERIGALLELGTWLASADPRSAVAVADEGLAAARKSGDEVLLAKAMRVHAQAQLHTVGPRAAYEELGRARALSVELDDTVGIAWCDHFIGVTLEYLGDPGGSTVYLERALNGFVAAGDPGGQSWSLSALGDNQFLVDRLDEALALLQRARGLAEQSNDRLAEGAALVHLGEVHGKMGVRAAGFGRGTQARSAFAASLGSLRRAYEGAMQSGDIAREPVALSTQVLPLCWLGRYNEAIIVAEHALRLAGEIDLDSISVGALHYAGMAYLATGAVAQAIAHLQRALALHEQWELTYDTVEVLRLLVQAHETSGDIATALALHKRLLTAELLLRDRVGDREDQIAVARFEAERRSEVSEADGARLQRLSRVNRRLAGERRAMERLAHTDALTGIANRRHFDAALTRLLVQAELTQENVSLVLLDLDFFKRINDTHSHVVGDRVLATVAAELARHCRASDLAARVGGEEFAVLLPGIDIVAAELVAQRLRNSIAELELSQAAPGLQVTVSAGVASASGGDSTALVAAADRALYQAKTGGRNQVRVAEPVSAGS